jgi:hypothetical protein
VRAGLAFQFESDGSLVDLSSFTSITLVADVTEGGPFEVFLGRGSELGCSYLFSNSDPAATPGSFSSSLASPAWCFPSQCGFNLAASGGMVLASVPTVSTLGATIRALKFVKGDVPAGGARAFMAGIGPGNFCWFLVGWKSATTAWQSGPVTSSSAHVEAMAKGNGVAGMAFELPAGYTLSRYRRLIMTANVLPDSRTSSFLIQGVRDESGLIWRFTPSAGLRRYEVNLASPEGHFPSDKPKLGLDQVQRFEIVTSGGDSYLNADVSAVAFTEN